MTVRAKMSPRRFLSKLKEPLGVKKITRTKPAKASAVVRRFRASAVVLLSTRIALMFC